MMEELAASVFDEFNQPLTNIVINGEACLRFLTRDAPNVEQAREAVRDVLRDAKRACEAYLRVQALARRQFPAETNLNK
jgi:two-component system, LuxR family, sensor kinase FixL